MSVQMIPALTAVQMEGVRNRVQFASVYTTPDRGLVRGPLMSRGAALLGSTDFGGVCPGYRRVGLAARVAGGWWRIKGQACGRAEHAEVRP